VNPVPAGRRSRVAVNPQTHQDLRRLPPGAKDALGDFVHRLRADRTNRALRLTPLRTAGDGGELYTASLGTAYAVLLLETERDRFTVLAVREAGHAGELPGLTVAVNPVSGAVEVVDRRATEVVRLPQRPRQAASEAADAPEEGPVAEPSALRAPLFADHDDATLRGLGVVASLLPAVRRLSTDAQLDALLGHNLPDLTREVLRALGDGMPAAQVREQISSRWRPDDVDTVDTGDWVRAARRPASQVSTEDGDVLGALGEGFEAWRVFLHPEQRRLATGSYRGSTKVTGGPGTGKTVVALHRVRHLVEALPAGRNRPVLLTTFTTNLADDLRARLYRLVGPELADRVDVRSVDKLARQVVDEAPGAGPGRPLDDAHALDLWHTVRTETGVLDYGADFLDTEFRHVILAQRCTTRASYMRAERRGRPRLTRADRARVWQLTEAYREHLTESRRTTHDLLADTAARIEEVRMARTAEQARYKAEKGGVDLVHREAGSGMWLKPRYRHVVVDEAQDLSAAHWRMLRAMVPPGPDDIFLVGDAHQRIYAHHVVLGRLGIETRGRASRRLTLSYRTTRQILRTAGRLVAGEEFDDLDEGVDTLDGYRSVLTGAAPQFWQAPDWQTEMRLVATLVRERHERDGTPYAAMAVGVPDGASATQLAHTLGSAPFRIPAVELGSSAVGERDAVRVGTLYRFKGLEFQRVFLAAMSEGQVPHQRIEQYRTTDPERYRQEEQRARSLAFVAATRARDELAVSWNGRPSRFLPDAVSRRARPARTALSPEGPPPSGDAVA
jgi:superfamily I DNA/RNA helicase